MVSEVVEAPEKQADQAPPEQQTETPATEAVAEGAAETQPEAAVPQVEVTETKPDYLTREEWEREKREVADRAAQEALEADRRRRQTENARKAQQEERLRQRIKQTVDTVRTALVSRNIDPDVATDESVVTAIDRVAQERAEALVKEQAELVGGAWDYLTAKAYGKDVDWDDQYADVARILHPRPQNLVEALRPTFEAEARKGYVPESRIPEIEKAAVERHIAREREKQGELKRPDGTPAAIDNSDEARLARLAGRGAPPTQADREWFAQKYPDRR